MTIISDTSCSKMWITTIHLVNHYPGEKYKETNCLIFWIEIYLVDNTINLLNNLVTAFSNSSCSLKLFEHG